MKEHELKTWPPFYGHVVDGRKPFEIRKNDRNYQYGDTLLLREWLPNEKRYTGQWIRKRVVYVLDGEIFGLQPGYVALGLGSP